MVGSLYDSGGIGHLIIDATLRFSSRVAFRDGGRDTTYSEFEALLSRACATFTHLGLQPGDSIVQLVQNNVSGFALIAASYIYGLRSVTLQPLSGIEDKLHIILETDCRLFVCDSAYAQMSEALRKGAPHIQHWRCHIPHADWKCFWQETLDRDPQPLRCEVGSEDVIRIAYTGGTTGRPKGIELTSRSMLACAMQIMCGWSWPESPKYLCSMPMTHGAGALIIPTLCKGGCVVFRQKFDAHDFVATLRAEACNVTWLVPTAIYKLLDNPDHQREDWANMHALVYSGAPMAHPRIKQAFREFGPCLVQMYGQTEAPSAVLTLTQYDHQLEDEEILGSAGRPFPGVRVTLLGDTGAPVPPGQIGEICVRGPIVMNGYLGQPEATQTALSGDWLHTGDLAMETSRGYLVIVDRKKDMIITGGFNVYPKEVEDALSQHPAVTAVAVVGEPDPLWGEIVVAYAELRPGADVPGESELIEFVKQRKSSINCPKKVRFIEAMPLTNFGKIDKKALRKAD
ncbi:AMP-binding protein [Xanthobacter dioxanivorans]|uniref:AMP-binding protein n=1 Tax=Xanthobacter dioxanivorans TaxID=2528964 RepID=A0A974PRZ3_9HYPH|nr:AMP-binding protein [Xanthobacter dioxanivorans]QRG08669.1 AMP-binding protein [Xanthobacter dioxanivorans]